MNYAIFRSQPIMTINDLAQVGSHNKREKKAYNSNPDIKLELSKDNIEIVPLAEKYVKGFKLITKEYEKEHNERMKTERSERRKTFNQMLDRSKNVVADELLFTATHKYFNNKSKDEIIRWANTCMDFVYEDLGYTKEQVLHATIHLDELTPHLHCVVVPLVKKFDNRTKTERYTISKKQYIRDKLHLSELQDKCHKRLNDNGFELERGIKGSNAVHQNTRELKKTTRYYEQKVEVMNKNLNNAMEDFEEKMKTTKNTFIDKEYVKVKKDTFESMNKVINESKKIIEFQPKIEQLFEEVDTFTKSHQTLENENKSLNKEIKSLKTRNTNLTTEKNKLQTTLEMILSIIKEFFKEILHFGNNRLKEAATSEIKVLYKEEQFDSDDICFMAKNTTKEDELFDYADIPSYMRTPKESYYEDRDKDDDFGLGY